MNNTNRVLNDAEKLLVAMGAAIGGGCGKCAENLVRIAHEQGVKAPDMAAACREGFAAKGAAIEAMKDKVAALLKTPVPESDGIGKEADMGRIAALIRAAACAAANSAPDTIKEMKKACLQGAAKGDFQMCLSIAKSIRKKAAQFSDEDVAAGTGNDDSAKSQKIDKTRDVCPGDGSACVCGCK
jgi:hypothetical protein